LIEVKLKKKWKGASFFEKFAEFEHLLDEEHKLILSQLKSKMNKIKYSAKDLSAAHARTDNYTTVHDRADKDIGTGHVDNTRGELKRLAVPSHQELSLFLSKLEKKVLRMIDSLILHLKRSRDALTANEIKASEDFAIFQKNMFKENTFLTEKIKQLEHHLLKLNNRLNRANKQLVRRLKLQREAETQLANFRKMKKEKDDYCRKEHARRVGELANVSSAESIFQNVLNRLSVRVKVRSQARFDKKGEVAEHKHNVRDSERSVDDEFKKRRSERQEVAY